MAGSLRRSVRLPVVGLPADVLWGLLAFAFREVVPHGRLVRVTPDQAYEMMQLLVRERDEMQETIASWRDLETGEGVEAISAEIRNRVEHVRRMMRNAAHLVDAIDEVVKQYPAGVASELDEQRTRLLTDRRAMLAMWNDLAGTAERFNETLMRLAASREPS